MQAPIPGFERFPYQALLENMVLGAIWIGLLIWGIYLFNAALKRRQQMQMQKHLLDKFSSAHDFAEFMQSPAGQKYVMSFSDTVSSNPRASILNSVRLGIVLLFVGPAFCANPLPSIARHAIWTIGVVITMLGVGFLVSAVVSYLIAKRIKSEQAS